MLSQLSIAASIPCYNGEKTVAAAAASVRAQTVTVRELLIIDDGSTDGTGAAAQTCGDRVVRHPANIGRGAARARAVQELQTEFILFCDATIELPPNFVERALPHFQNDRVAAVFGRVAQQNSSSAVQRWRGRHLFKTEALNQLNRCATLATGGALLRRRSVLESGNFNPALMAGEDVDLGLRLLAGRWEVIFDPELKLTPLEENSLKQVLDRYARWNCAPGHRPSAREYAKLVRYSASVLAREDFLQRDFASAGISLLCPHYLFWSRFFARGNPGVFNGNKVCVTQS
jgi:glycosyltransferase involved in cell wall biosynthesis